MGKNPIFGIVWLIILVFIAWPVAGFIAGLWIFLQPFEALTTLKIKDCNDFLEKIITWPREMGRAIVDCSSTFPKPF